MQWLQFTDVQAFVLSNAFVSLQITNESEHLKQSEQTTVCKSTLPYNNSLNYKHAGLDSKALSK